VAARASSKRVAIVGTGSITHSFRRMDRSPSARWSEGEQIEREIVDLVLQQRYEDVAAFDRSKWERVEPEGDLGPGFILFGALDASFAARVVSTGQIWGAFGTTVIEFAPR
jgi:aromatic ring-opening dioxygenase catalytic subunit (LigB family)